METQKVNAKEAYDELSKKWAVPILKDLFFGRKRFTEFQEFHKDLSNKVLSDQLKRLEEVGLIKKEVISITPLKIEYALTEMGQSLNRMLYEKIIFAIKFGILARDDPYFGGQNIEEVFGINKVQPNIIDEN